MKKIISIVSLVVMLMALLIPTAFAANDDGTMTAWIKTGNGGSLNLREAANKSAKILVQLPYGTQVKVYPAAGGNDGWSVNGWCMVEPVDSKLYTGTGYVMSTYLSFTNPGTKPTPDEKVPTYQDVDAAVKALKIVEPYDAVIKTTRPTNYVHLRWIPNSSARFIDKYLAGEQITVLAESKTWAQVQIKETGYVGFILKSCVDALN